MATIVYLDVEDEITTAATRIRSAAEKRVALVLPFGSRVATSRINFRLLAREAMVNGRRLDVIAPDASARALAASAGLPVFASVGEYESALAAPDDDSIGPTAAAAAGVAAAGVAGRTGGTAADAGGAEAGGASTVVMEPPENGTPSPASGAGGAQGAGTTVVAGASAGRRPEPKVAKPRRRIRTGLLLGLGLLLVAIAVAGVAAYLVLPSADITVTPRIEAIGPISLTIRADPNATTVDPEARVIPAQTVDVPVTSSGEFPATGKRVQQTVATGGVRWTNCDPTAAYTIPRGTLVRTNGGTGFTTDEQAFLPVATISPSLKLTCQNSEVSVTAAKPGPDGNVGAGTIRVVPARYNRNVIRVTNPAATHGGKRQEFKRVSQKDLDAAQVQLHKDLEAQFATAVADPATAPEGATLFPDTALLGDATTDPDPATLLNKEQDTFTLSMSATGTVLAVDASPVQAIAETKLQESVSPGSTLVDGSIDVIVGDGTVEGGVVSFPVEGTAKQVRTLDAAALKDKVMGLGLDQARAALAPYGEVSIALWPGWASAVPTLGQRVNLVVGQPAGVSGSASPRPSSSAAPTHAPSRSPSHSSSPKPSGGASASEPLPSQ